ncbi:hypothetical protein FB479_101620 [Brevibacillus sp. AG162]|uniref:hypothetical protein n=1 Tax=Brevibacillus sp. AG162 TaxID=2572910 RepID=UPI001152A80D|nr:hypothetical protein [Brevibacillus sp. AG162]TQK75008.1 hypothetical protein FB479_101620 [Brevibacillus sp. AG162]
MFKRYTNKYARWIRILAFIISIVGFIVGLFIWFDDLNDNFLHFLTSVFYSVIPSIFLLGFAEGIEILYRIHLRLEFTAKDKPLFDETSESE